MCFFQVFQNSYLHFANKNSAPLIYSWSSQNTAGETKKKTTTAVLFIGQSAGNVRLVSQLQGSWANRYRSSDLTYTQRQKHQNTDVVCSQSMIQHSYCLT